MVSLFPSKSVVEVCQTIIDFFSSILGKTQGCQVTFGPEPTVGLVFTSESVLLRLKSLKKKDLHMEGDLLYLSYLPGQYVLFRDHGAALDCPVP